jgi:pimeloyl-ACP methyl ester carboxylesterase
METVMNRNQSDEPLCRLVRFPATDGVMLAGLLYEPKRRTRRAALFLHGTGGASIFDSHRTNLLAREFVDRGIAYFPFNNRGAHVERRLKRRTARETTSVMGGSAHELIADCVRDIDGAVRELQNRGYDEVFAIGHSTGANKLAVYDARKRRHDIRKFVLLAGGDDTGLLYQKLGERRFRAALVKGQQKIEAGEGEQFVPPALADLPMSWRAFVDMASPDGDYNVFPFLEAMSGIRLGRKPLFRHLRALKRPALMVYGERDEYCYDDVPGCVATLAEVLSGKGEVDLAIVRDADHGFTGVESGLGQLIVQFLLRKD